MIRISLYPYSTDGDEIKKNFCILHESKCIPDLPLALDRQMFDDDLRHRIKQLRYYHDCISKMLFDLGTLTYDEYLEYVKDINFNGEDDSIC